MRRFSALVLLIAASVFVLGAVGSNIPSRLTSAAPKWRMVGPGAGGGFNAAMETGEGVLLVGGDVGGAFRSTDQGRTWLPLGMLNSSTTSGASSIFDRTNTSAWGFDPRTDSSVVFAGIEGGILRSIDGGRTFHARMCDSSGVTDWIHSIDVCRWHPDTVLMAWNQNFNNTTNGCIRYNVSRGLSDSVFSGTLWRRVGTQGLPTGDRFIKVRCKPNNAQFIYALSGTDGQVDASALGGSPRSFRLYRKRGSSGTVNTNFLGGNWTDISPGGAADSVWDFAIHPYNPDTIFATTFTGSMRTDGHSGTTWVRVHQDSAWRPIAAHTGALVMSARGPALEPALYIIDPIRDYSPSCTECGVWKATAPTQQNTAPVSNGPFTRIEDGTNWGTGWQFMQKWAYSRSERGVGNTIVASARDTQTFYWTSSLFCFKGDTTGVFQQMFTDFRSQGPAAGNHFWTGKAIGNTIPMASDAVRGFAAVGWWDLGIGITLDGGLTWQLSNDSAMTAGAGGWLGHGGDCSTIVVDPIQTRRVWAAQGTGKTNTTVILSTQYGRPGTWQASDLPLGFTYGLTLDETKLASNQGRTLFVTSNGDLYRSTSSGALWDLVWDRATVQDSGLIAVGAQGSNVLAGGPNGLWRATNGGADSSTYTKIFPMPSGWVISTTGSRYDVRHRGIHDIVWGKPNEVFVTISGTASGNPVYVNAAGDSFGVYRSTDAGVTWTKVHGGGYDDKFHITADGAWWVSSRSVGAGGGLTVGEGLFRSKNQGRSWEQMAVGTQWPSFGSICSDPDGEWIMVNVLGVGVLRADLGLDYVRQRRGR